MTCVVLQTATKILQAMKIAREIHEKQSAQSPEVSTMQEDKTTTQEDKSSADTAMDVDEGEGAGFDADTGMVVQLTRTKGARKRASLCIVVERTWFIPSKVDPLRQVRTQPSRCVYFELR